jgi:hypothetical protein
MWRRMSSPILWTGLGLLCVMFTSPTGAAAAPDDRVPSSAPTEAGSALRGAGSARAGAAPARDTRIKSESTGDRRPAQRGAQSSADSKGRNSAAVAPRRSFETPQHGMHQSAGGGADRIRALNTQTRGRPAGQTSRPMGSNGAAPGVPALDVPGASKRYAMPVPKAAAVTTNSRIGGPRMQSMGRLGGPAMGGTNHSAAIDGRQFRRKF